MMLCKPSRGLLLLGYATLAVVHAEPLLGNALLAADPLDVPSDDVPDVDREELELRYFNMTFMLPNTSRPCRFEPGSRAEHCPDIAYHMQGYVPDTGKSYPAYLFVSGAGPWQNEVRNVPFDESMPEMTMVADMARRGYAAAVSEFPDIDGSHLRCHALSAGTPSLMEHSRQIFGWSGPSDKISVGPLAQLCRSEGTDCSRGIALHGHSVGGLITNLAPRFAPVTAMLLWGAGSRLPYGFSCCGVNSYNFTCCAAGDGMTSPVGELGAIGGTELPCEMYNTTRKHLDRTRRRLIIATEDHEYGDCDRDMMRQIGTGPSTTWVPARPGLTMCNASDGWNPFGALILGRRDSGYDCGNSTECIQPDGSGYNMPGWRQIGDEVAITNGHNFHTIIPQLDQNTPGCEHGTDAPECNIGYVLNPNWVTSTEPWGMMPSIEWLAATAVRG